MCLMCVRFDAHVYMCIPSSDGVWGSVLFLDGLCAIMISQISTARVSFSEAGGIYGRGHPGALLGQRRASETSRYEIKRTTGWHGMRSELKCMILKPSLWFGCLTPIASAGNVCVVRLAPEKGKKRDAPFWAKIPFDGRPLSVEVFLPSPRSQTPVSYVRAHLSPH